MLKLQRYKLQNKSRASPWRTVAEVLNLLQICLHSSGSSTTQEMKKHESIRSTLVSESIRCASRSHG